MAIGKYFSLEMNFYATFRSSFFNSNRWLFGQVGLCIWFQRCRRRAPCGWLRRIYGLLFFRCRWILDELAFWGPCTRSFQWLECLVGGQFLWVLGHRCLFLCRILCVLWACLVSVQPFLSRCLCLSAWWPHPAWIDSHSALGGVSSSQIPDTWLIIRCHYLQYPRHHAPLSSSISVNWDLLNCSKYAFVC